MKIVVLDGFTLNPGDLDWSALSAFGEYTVHDRTPPELTVERAGTAEAVFTNKVILGRAEMAQLPQLRYIGVLATGYNVVDVAAAREMGIVVTNVPTYGTRSVAQMTFALLLELTQHVGHHSQSTAAGRWSTSVDFCYWDFPLVELEGLVMGLIGLGRIGRAVAELAMAFGMKVIAHDANVAAGNDQPGIEMVDLDTLFKRSDIVSLHCPLTQKNAGMVNAGTLAMMKPTAFLLNTARGPLLNETDVAEALNAGRIAGAGLDVLAVEPPQAANPLLTARNCLVTPHISWATTAARRRLMSTAVQNLSAFINTKPQNVVS